MRVPPPSDDASKAPPMEGGAMPPPMQPPIYSAQEPGYPPQQSGYPPQQYPQQPPPGYPPPQGGYPQQPQQPGYEQKYAPGPGQPGQPGGTTHTTIVTQPAIVPTIVMAFHESPMSMSCPCCGQHIVTGVRYDNGTMAWLLCIILCLVGLWPCACIPLCMQGCQDVVHTCPSCHAQVGVYRRM